MKKAFAICLMLVSLLFAPNEAHSGPADIIKAGITERLMAQSPWEEGSVEVEEIRISGFDESVQFTSVEVTIPRGLRNAGKVSVLVTLFKDSKEVKTLWATARIKAYKDAVVALKPLRMNTGIEPGDVKVVRVDVSDMHDAISSVEEAAGMIVKRPISAGSVIRKDSIKSQLAVRRGEKVMLVIESGAVRIRSVAIASAEGAVGALISARTQGGKEVMARVTGPGMASV
ncbi:MAG: flagellar basal body P-ring formation chaperone FlgA, partial [Deltaproteobacteria bacterium]